MTVYLYFLDVYLPSYIIYMYIIYDYFHLLTVFYNIWKDFKMLAYNFDRIFKARGIVKPFSFLVKSGIPDKIATKLKNNNIRRLELNMLERLCVLLNCTPNDLLEWTPDEDFSGNDDHPLNEIRKSADAVDIVKTLNTVPLNKLKEIEQLINEKLQNSE